MAYSTFQNVYDKTGLSTTEIGSSIVTSLIADSDAEIDMLTQRKFSDANAKTEYLSGSTKDILGYSGTNITTINLSDYPILSISEFKVLDIDGNATQTYTNLTTVQIAAGTYDTTDYWIDTMIDPLTNSQIPYGKITLKSDIFPTGRNNIKVTYTYGYVTTPNVIKNLSTCLAGIRTWIYFMGGQYNRFDSYSVPEQTGSKGDFYARALQNIKILQEEADRLLDRIGRKPRTLFYASSDLR
jgi:hypothetical protein